MRHQIKARELPTTTTPNTKSEETQNSSEEITSPLSKTPKINEKPRGLSVFDKFDSENQMPEEEKE